MSKESQRRHRARLRGEDVPRLKPGPKIGYKQSPEHIANAVQGGAGAPLKENVSVKSARSRAQRWYPDTGPCEFCGAEPAERHHRDSDARNNARSNIALACRRCHMKLDGRLDALIAHRRQIPASVYAGAHAHRPRENGRFI